MVGDELRARGRSMEEAFFAHEGERLRVALRAAGAKGVAELGHDLGIAGDPQVFRDMSSHAVAGDTAAAMVLIPLIAVAWADRDLHAAERAAVLAGAEAAGIAKGSASEALLASWLNERPDPELFESWKSFIVAFCADMDVHAVEALRKELVGRARTVAEAAGGLLGYGRISGRERDVLEELEHAFPA
jgi:hypothetical protein